MPSTWFIVKPDRELGPYTSAQIKQLAASGQLKTADQVRRADQKTPVAAGKIRGLFPENECPDHPKTTPPPLPTERPESGTPELSQPPILSLSEASERPKTTPPPLPSEKTQSGTSDSSGPPPLPSSRTRFDDIRKTLGELTETTKAAGHLAFAEVRKARLVKITLPAAYLALGRDIFTTGRFRSEFPELYAEIERVQSEITRLTTGREGKPGGTFAEKAKQTVSKVKDTAQAKALGLKVDSLMRRLGEAGYAAQNETSGSEPLVRRVSDCLSEIRQNEEQVRQTSAASQGRFVSPRRLLYGSIGVLAVIALLAVANRSSNIAPESGAAFPPPTPAPPPTFPAITPNRPVAPAPSPHVTALPHVPSPAPSIAAPPVVKPMPLPSVSGRGLKVSVDTPGIDRMRLQHVIQRMNAGLSSVRCIATENNIVLEFDVDDSQWGSLFHPIPLLVRLFDKNGQYLTHFITAEGFTVYPQVANAPSVAFGRRAVLLKPTGNRLVYGVNVRDLRDASIVEIGFWDSETFR